MSSPIYQLTPVSVLAELAARHEEATGYPPVAFVHTSLFTAALGLDLKARNLIPLAEEVPLRRPFIFRGATHITSDAAFPETMPMAVAVFPVKAH